MAGKQAVFVLSCLSVPLFGLFLGVPVVAQQVATGRSVQAPAVSAESTQWLAQAILYAEQVKPGMTRWEIKQLLAAQAGFRGATQQTFTFPQNAYVHIDVRFKVKKDAEGRCFERPDDRATFVSRPYLAWAIMD